MVCAPLVAFISGWIAHSSGLNHQSAITISIAIW
ncbi:uncharacterized protein METZ01_LOCUS146336, partial [marine metagenome]